MDFSSSVGFFFVSILGCVLHFAYACSNHNLLVAAVTPVNESVWEHLKLLFFPFILFILIEFFSYGKHIGGFLFSGMIGVLCGMIWIAAGFYIYSALFGTPGFLANLILFFTAVLLSFRIRCARVIKQTDTGKMRTFPGLIMMLCMTILFVGFTFSPPDSPLFIPPAP